MRPAKISDTACWRLATLYPQRFESTKCDASVIRGRLATQHDGMTPERTALQL